MKTILIFFIEIYQKVVSPWTPNSCRFYPTCSQYAKISIKKYGFIKGSYLSIKRVLKCHPFNSGGYDPVE